MSVHFVPYSTSYKLIIELSFTWTGATISCVGASCLCCISWCITSNIYSRYRYVKTTYFTILKKFLKVSFLVGYSLTKF